MSVGVDSLPREVLAKIFSYLSYKDLVKSIQFVCTWWQHVSWEKALWKHITYAPHSRRKHFIKRLKISPQLRSLSLVAVTVDSNVIQAISDSCPNLEKLDLCWDSVCDNEEVLMDNPMSQIKILKLVLAEESFMDFEIVDSIFPNVESLHIGNLTFNRKDLMDYLKKKQDSLHTLCISCCADDDLCVLSCLSVCTKLSKLCLCEVCYDVDRLSCKELENFKNISELSIRFSDLSVDSAVFSCFPNITELELCGRTEASGDTLCIIARNYPQLQKLKLTSFYPRCFGHPLLLDNLLKYAPNFERLTHLSIHNHYHLTDEGIKHLQLMPELTHLDLYECDLVPTTCIKLICGFSKLEVLKFDLRYKQIPADLRASDVKNKDLQLMFYNGQNISALDSLRQQRLRVCLI